MGGGGNNMPSPEEQARRKQEQADIWNQAGAARPAGTLTANYMPSSYGQVSSPTYRQFDTPIANPVQSGVNTSINALPNQASKGNQPTQGYGKYTGFFNNERNIGINK